MKEVMDYRHADESKTIREKLNSTIVDMMTADNEETKFLSYGGGFASICYNSDIIDGVKYKLPNTSDELDLLTIDLQSNSITPFIHFAGGGYAHYILNAWQAQYDGLDYYNNTFLKLNSEGDRNTPQKSVFLEKDGRYEALKAMEK